MSDTIYIQSYESKYQSEVVDLIIHIQQKEYNVPITKEEQPDLQEIEQFYQRDNGSFWVATHDGKVVGTVALLDIGNQQVALRKMFVKKNFGARCGIPRACYSKQLSLGQKKEN